jgi:hypothetical protein
MARRRIAFGFYRGVLWFAACLLIFTTAFSAFAGWHIIVRPMASASPILPLE